MNNFRDQLALVSKVDTENNIWLIQTAVRQWCTYNDKKQITNPQGGEYAAVVQINLSSGMPHNVSHKLELPVSAQVVRAHFVWALPGHIDAQTELWTNSASIADPVLKDFLVAVLSDAKIMYAFYRGKASHSFHHSVKGELFTHSVEVAVAAKQMAAEFGLSQRTQDCAFVCGLLHDIGKLLMFYNTGKDKEQGVNGQHEAFSFMVLAEHLEQLKAADKVLFEVVSATLSAQVSHKKHYEYIEEAIVRAVDRISAHKNELQAAFKGKPSTKLYANTPRGRKLKRLGIAQSCA